MSDAEMKRVFTALGMTVEGNTVTVPSFRSDIESIYDLSEEAARIYGYDKIPAKVSVRKSEPEVLRKDRNSIRKRAFLCVPADIRK